MIRGLFPLILISFSVLIGINASDFDEIFVPAWGCKIPGGKEVADQVAKDHGMNNRGKVRKD